MEVSLLKFFDYLIGLIHKYIISPLYKLLFFRRRKKFLKNVWKPALEGINQGLEDFFSEEALDDSPEITETFTKAEKSKSILGEKVYFFIDNDETKRQDLDRDTKYNTLSVLRIERTRSIVKHLDHNLKSAVENISDREIIDDMGEEVMDFGSKSEELEENERMIEDLHYDGKIRPIFREIKRKYGDRKPDYRTRDEVKAFIHNEYKKFLKSDGGIIHIVSQTQLKYLNKGLRVWFIPFSSGKNPPKRLHDWRIFFIDENKNVHSFARITGMNKGKFSKLRKKYSQNINVPGLNKREVDKLVEDWVKGIGGTISKKGKKHTGTAVEVIYIKFTDYYKIDDDELVVDTDIEGMYGYITIEYSRELFQKYLE